jgi:chemotaxis protein CheD
MSTSNTSINWKERRAPDDYFGGSRRYFDSALNATVVNVHAGDCFVTDKPDEIAATVLGSCISACIRDPIVKVGGMNHFLLPGTTKEQDTARFGAFAMEKLINEILKRGGRRERLEIKLFGGGNVIKSSALIGTKNIEFVHNYLAVEEFPIAGEDVGGTWPRKVRYTPVTGKAFVLKMRREEDYKNVERAEADYTKAIAAPSRGDVELF